MRILVTGASGFLGSHFAEKYLNEGHEIIAVDNFFTGKKDNLKNLISNPNFELVRHDITQPLLVEVDAIANFACPASPIHYQKYPVQTIQTSVLGVTNLLDLAKKLNIQILQASTSEVYGDPQISEQVETYWGNVNPIGIRSCYDEGKRVAETLMFDYHRQYGVKIKIARIFNTYGPRMALDDGRVVTNFIVQALRGEPITIYGDGSQTRSFSFVSDTIEGLSKLFDAPTGIMGPINIGNPKEFTILQLAEEIIRLTNSKSPLIRKPLPMDDPQQRKPDISLARKELDWEPHIQLEEGLRITISDIKTKFESKHFTA
jgi:UDP-glucuronate decarboxylase